MKKLKIWLMAMVAIMTSVTFTACGDDDKKGDEPDVIDSPIVGTWYYEDLYTNGGYEKTITFKSDGTYDWVETEYYRNGSWTFRESGTYSVNKNNLTLKCTKIYGEEDKGPYSEYIGEINHFNFYTTGKTLTIEIEPGDSEEYFRI